MKAANGTSSEQASGSDLALEQRVDPSGDHDNRRKCDMEAHASNGSVTISASCQFATFQIRTVLSSPALDRYCSIRP
ncbi:hypothetical protein PsorP6_007499 [Peronosclerospora sorghi]|uniref:Uncharacterized protein n=1 Tax=Peronosclerospora sorghi TaxID=230839 RepID=A0ACC0WA91_9STRA|nr:hypothetical protein PsorP6_007499 [Peronosclerospora sorghi]